MTTRESSTTETAPTLTPEAVREIAGPIEDDRIALIIATGATEGELLRAVNWLEEDDVMGRRIHGFTHDILSGLCEILAAGEPAPEDERD